MSDSLKITGPIAAIGEAKQISDKLKKQELVITVGDKYPEPVAVEFANDKIDLLHGLAVGQIVTAHFNLRGREWNGRYFVNLSGWKVEQEGAAASAQPSNDFKSANKNPSLRAQPNTAIVDDGEGLPF